MAYQRIVVMPANNLCPNDFWDVREALVVQHAIDLVLVFWIFRLGFSDLLVFGLQLV